MKTILITGSTDGIGKLAAKKLAHDQHMIYVHGRNPEKLDKVIREIKQETGNDNIAGFAADLSDLQTVKKFAETVANEVTKLDVLINNAGIFHSSVNTTKDAHDIRFVVNYFAACLLTETLLPLLKKTKNARIINLSSAAQAPVSIDALIGKKTLGVNAAYAQSKLALTMWSFELARQVKEDNINVVAVNPGSLLNTNMVKEAYGQHWSSADKGAKILYELAVGAQFANDTGKYFDNDLSPKGSDALGNFNDAHPEAYHAEKIHRLLDATKEILHGYIDS